MQCHGVGGPGELIITRFHQHPDFGDALRIDRADPEIWISDEILLDLFWNRGRHLECVSLTRPAEGHGSTGHGVGEYPECDSWELIGGVCFVNNLFKVAGTNQTVVYRIERYLHGQRCWVGRWPD